jgi:hypothetical protein
MMNYQAMPRNGLAIQQLTSIQTAIGRTQLARSVNPLTEYYNGELLNAVCLKCKKQKTKKTKETHHNRGEPTPEEMNDNCCFGYCKPIIDDYIVSIVETECKGNGKDGEKTITTHIEKGMYGLPQAGILFDHTVQ